MLIIIGPLPELCSFLREKEGGEEGESHVDTSASKCRG